MRLLLIWLLNSLALFAVTMVLPGVHIERWWPYALIAVLVLGLVNALVRPILVILTLPITVVTLGLFLLVINALLFWWVGSVLEGFRVDGFWWAMAGALLYSLFSWAFSTVLNK
jgi:putative membrane protein